MDFPAKIKFGERPVKKPAIGIGADLAIFFISNPPGNLAGRGFRKSGSRKILLSKNLDLKILKPGHLGRRESISLDRHCLDHDYASSMAGTRSDVTRGLWKCLGRFTKT